MTHDELLQRISLIDEVIHMGLGDVTVQKSSSPFSALRAVVKLHKWEDKHRGMRMKQRCPECGFAYPCPTIEAIVKELR